MLKKVFYAAVLVMAVAVSFTSCQKEDGINTGSESSKLVNKPFPDSSSRIFLGSGNVVNKLKCYEEGYYSIDNPYKIGVAIDSKLNKYKTLLVSYGGKKFHIMLENLKLQDVEGWQNIDTQNPNLKSDITSQGYLYSINAAKRLQVRVRRWSDVQKKYVYGRLPKIADIQALLQTTQNPTLGNSHVIGEVDDLELLNLGTYLDYFLTGEVSKATTQSDAEFLPMENKTLGGTRSIVGTNQVFFSDLNRNGSFWTNEQIIPGLYYHFYIMKNWTDGNHIVRPWTAWLWTWQNTGLAFSVRYIFDGE